ncbi:MAG: hypothetical protein WBZ29_17085 [Methanocella sp.]
MAEFQEQIGGQNERMREELNVVLERLNHSSEQLSDVKRQVAITGKVIDLYWKLESKSITMEDYQKQLMCVLQDW